MSSTPAPAGSTPHRYTVALLGFSAFERAALASFFRLAAQRSPAYHQVDEPALADFVIADADQRAVAEALPALGRLHHMVCIGARAPSGVGAWLTRPIEPNHIVRALDGLAARRHGHGGTPAEPLSPREVDLLLEDLGSAAVPPRPLQGGGREVLVVEDSGIARKFLAQRLARQGYTVQVALSADEALEQLATRPFAIVFADVVLGPPGSTDGLALCQAVKQQLVAPPVVIVSGRSGPADRVRGSLAGADAYLGKPIDEAEFLAALRRVDPAFAAA